MEELKAGLIFKQIPKIMKDIKPISKDQVNQAQRFKFRGIDDVYNACQTILAKHGVFTIPEIIGRSRENVTTKSGTRAYHCVNQYKFRFYAEDGSFVEAYADGEAMDMGDKATNKCAAIAHKYALLQTFCIPTAELNDPDAESPQIGQGQQKPPQQQMPQQNTLANPTRPGGVSQKQLKRLFAIRSKVGLRDEEVVRLATQLYGIQQLADLNQEQYQALCEKIERTPNRGQQSADNLTAQYGGGGL